MVIQYVCLRNTTIPLSTYVFGYLTRYDFDPPKKKLHDRTDAYKYIKTGLLKRSQKCIQKISVTSSKNKIIFSHAFYLTLWLMKLPKHIQKIPILKTWQLVFFWGVKTYFGILPLKWGMKKMILTNNNVLAFVPIKI